MQPNRQKGTIIMENKEINWIGKRSTPEELRERYKDNPSVFTLDWCLMVRVLSVENLAKKLGISIEEADQKMYNSSTVTIEDYIKVYQSMTVGEILREEALYERSFEEE